MNIEETQVGAVTVLKPEGALSQDDTEPFGQRLTEALGRSFRRLVVDMSAVPFVDSRGLEVLVDATEELAESGHALKLAGTNELLREVLELTELTSLFEHYEDVNAAARSFL